MKAIWQVLQHLRGSGHRGAHKDSNRLETLRILTLRGSNLQASGQKEKGNTSLNGTGASSVPGESVQEKFPSGAVELFRSGKQRGLTSRLGRSSLNYVHISKHFTVAGES